MTTRGRTRCSFDTCRRLSVNGGRCPAHPHVARSTTSTPEPVSLAMPSDMTPEAADLWSEFCPRHEASGNVSDGDATMLAAYCEAVALANRMRDALRVPLVKTTNGGVRVSPAVSVWREAVQTALRIAEHFGWTPLARMRVKADEDPTNEDTAEAGVWSSYTAGSG